MNPEALATSATRIFAFGKKITASEGGGLARYDKFPSERMVEFNDKVASTPKAGGTMLDNTIVYYGCSNSRTHVNRDDPLLLCGGTNLGLKHGEFHKLNDKNIPLSNLYVKIVREKVSMRF